MDDIYIYILMGLLLSCFHFFFSFLMVISDQEEEKKKKSGFMEEGPVEKKLRETGEWVITNTEGEFRSNGTSLFLVKFNFLFKYF